MDKLERLLGRLILPIKGAIVYLEPPPNSSPESERLQKLYDNCLAGELERPSGITPLDEPLEISPGWLRPGKRLEMRQQETAEGKRIVCLEKVERPKAPGEWFTAYVNPENEGGEK